MHPDLPIPRGEGRVVCVSEMNAFVRFVRRRDDAAPFLALFHDDGADERASLRIGRTLWAGAPMASVRGPYRHGAGWRHLSDPACDEADLLDEAAALDRVAEAVATAVKRDRQLVEVIGVGEGGGADTALALLCRHPALFAGAILCRPTRRWTDASLEEIETGNGVEVLIVTEPDKVAASLRAKVMLSLSGHHARIDLAERAEEIERCRIWLRRELGMEANDNA